MTPRPSREGEDPDCAIQLARWNYTIEPRTAEEQETAAKLDKAEILTETTRVKRKYTKKSKGSN